MHWKVIGVWTYILKYLYIYIREEVQLFLDGASYPGLPYLTIIQITNTVV